MSKKKEVQAVTAAEDLGAAVVDTSSTAGGECPSSVTCGDSLKVNCPAGAREATLGCSPEGRSQIGKVKLIVNKSMTVPEIKDGRVQLRAAYGGTVYSGSRREFGTGVFAELPVGCMGYITPEKRLKENSSLLCADIRYAWEEGEISVTLHNVGIRNCDIQPGQLIAEMIIVPYLEAEI